jgi:hypothetical protein
MDEFMGFTSRELIELRKFMDNLGVKDIYELLPHETMLKIERNLLYKSIEDNKKRINKIDKALYK